MRVAVKRVRVAAVLATSGRTRASYVLAAIAVAMPMVAELSAAVAHAQLFVLPLIVVTVIVFTCVDVRARWRADSRGEPGGWRRALGHGLLATLIGTGGFILSARVTLGVPRYVRARAQGAIESVELWKRDHGRVPPERSDPEFPEALRRALRASRCSYLPAGESYSVTCSGVLFTKCTYDGKTGLWSSWD